MATIVAIHKQDKDRKSRELQTYISLLSCIGKTMERLVHNRLTWFLEENKILINEQADFRTGRCTEDQITLILQKIEDGFQKKKNHMGGHGKSQRMEKRPIVQTLKM
ncbi:RNA-directed DNA polymerase from [Elysia marginata]|uniref:RNA-directed DNA polymerase from n=1 Tax=Elysia marginata TaxID=1093978 RepID=A0AAV4JL26_9GAST|nr:RNA-directed DNA polymerase from [Elysia marginata]